METAQAATTTAHTHSAGDQPETPVKLSDKAAAMVKETIERENLVGAGLRVAVVGGGCSGFQYSLDLEKEERPGAAVKKGQDLGIAETNPSFDVDDWDVPMKVRWA